MGARILIEHGPDRGGSFVVPARATEVRIGRGPGMNIPVSDPSWQGTVRVMPRYGLVAATANPQSVTATKGQTLRADFGFDLPDGWSLPYSIDTGALLDAFFGHKRR